MAYKKIIIGIIIIIILILVLWAYSTMDFLKTMKEFENVSPSISPAPAESTKPVAESIPAVTVIATGLNIPWDIAFLDDGYLITERVGNLVYLKKDGQKSIIKIPHPVPKGEGGLLGIVLHPDFKTNKYLYLYMTTSQDNEGTKNTVFRYKFTDNQLTDEKIIISNIPGALYHDGGRMEFGPDRLLYITTGDAQNPNIAQDKNSLGGKILRLHDDGRVPIDNPFNNAVYSYGHRNPQGLAWDHRGVLWETEHGRSGITSGLDELNMIEMGKNYGWPTIEGDKEKMEMVKPVLHSGEKDTWAPASAVYHDGSIYFGGLKGEALYEVVLPQRGLNPTDYQLKTHFKNEYGRIRTIRLGPDDMFYITTSNRDGRGTASPDDDRLIRINPKSLVL